MENPYGSVMQDDSRFVHFNTGTLYDLTAGKYEVGVDGKFYLNGGISMYIIGVNGRPNTYKSTWTDGIFMSVIKNYNEAYGVNLDIEHSKDKYRMLSFASDILRIETGDVADRVVLKAGGEWTTNRTWELVKELVGFRKKNPKDFKLTSPFLDYDGKPIVTWKPLMIEIDTLSEMTSDHEHTKLFEGKEIEDKKNKTVYMEDGNMKTMIVSSLNKYCNMYGVTIMAVAHVGDNISFDNAPPRKQLAHMKQGDRIKGCGSKFTQLTHVLAQIISCTPAMDSAKAALYPHGDTSAVDLNEIVVKATRNKIQSAGMPVPYIVSQEYGMLTDVSYLHFLRTNGYVGLDGGPSKPKHACVFYPDVKFSRKSFREQAKTDYKLVRAIEIAAMYRYIQLCWNKSSLPFDFNRTPEEIYEKMKAKGIVDRVLESTRIWNYQKSEREQLSLFEILAMIDCDDYKEDTTGSKKK